MVRPLTLFMICAAMVISCMDPQSVDRHYSRLLITARFSGPVYQGNYYETSLPRTDWVIWIEDESGCLIKTLRINKGAVQVSAHGEHTGHLPVWKACANPRMPSDTGIPPDFDGITGASPLFSGMLADTVITTEWDFTDMRGFPVVAGTYHFCIETANIVKNKGGTGELIVNECTRGTACSPPAAVTGGVPTLHIASLVGALR